MYLGSYDNATKIIFILSKMELLRITLPLLDNFWIPHFVIGELAEAA
jgi:hypothetical protein